MTNEHDIAIGMLIDVHENYLRARRNLDRFIGFAHDHGVTDPEIESILETAPEDD